MNGKILLDTNFVIALFAREPIVKERLIKAEEVFLPVIVLGELYFGARKSSRVEENIKRIDEFAVSCSILTCDIETAKVYGFIKNDLRIKGKPIPENEIWIAATAKRFGLTVVSRDTHFEEVEGLKLETW